MRTTTARLRPGVLVLAALLGVAAGGGDGRVVDAAKRADWNAVRALIEQRVDVNAAGADGSTALHWASYWNDAGTASLLIRAGAAVNAATDLGVTPLWSACENGSTAIVDVLLRAGANPNAALLSGETPLMTAARGGSAVIVEQLLAKGADPNDREHGQHQTALMWAAAQRHAAVVQVLLAHGADVRARSKSWTELVKLTTEAVNPGYNTEVQQGGYTPLLFAARVGDLASARLLVAAGADVNDTAAYGTSATVVAAHSGHGNVAAFLLEKGADPNAAAAGYAAMHAAILHRDENLVRALLDHGADPNLKVRRSTPARRESIDYHLNPAMVGATPFWLAARFTAPSIMRLLAARGADPLFVHDVSYLRGFKADRLVEGPTTAVMAAADMGGRLYRVAGDDRFPPVETEASTLEAIKVAAELGVNVNAANADGNTALHAVSGKGFNSAVAWLIEKGARVDVKNSRGQTPLVAAARHPRTVELLRRLGAND